MPPKPVPGGLGHKIAGELEAVTLMKVTKVGFENARSNDGRIKKGETIAALRDSALMEGDSALVIAAGPSIHRFPTAEIIRKSGFKGTIVATESSMAWCLRNGIVPDLVVTLDPHPYRIARWFGDPELTEELIAKDDYYARQDMDPKFQKDQLNFNRELIGLIDKHGPKMSIAVASAAADSVVRRVEQAGMKAYWWNPMYDDYDKPDSLTRKIHALNGLPCINAGGNVGSACWVFAHEVLLKKHVAVVGMDLSYYADTSYKQTQYYYEIIDLVGEARLDEVYVRIHNPHLKKDFYTDPAYLWYRNIFLDMAPNAECATYNCTGGGILFGPAIHWMGLEDFLAGKRSGPRQLQAK